MRGRRSGAFPALPSPIAVVQPPFSPATPVPLVGMPEISPTEGISDGYLMKWSILAPVCLGEVCLSFVLFGGLLP